MRAVNTVFNDFDYAVSPLQQAAAFESLWLDPNATTKKISDKTIHQNHQSLPLTTFISCEKMLEQEQQLKKLFNGSHNHIYMSCYGDADYPKKLLDAKSPVPLLYFSGAWDLVCSPSVSIVGTRNPTKDGILRTKKLVRKLVNDGYTIISGLAQGIDTAAHEAAIEAGGKTIAVIGTSILDIYPKKNKELQTYIAKNHLLISQVPILLYRQQNYLKNRYFFPERNKTMSALSQGTFIIEASETSGTLIQARAALYQKRKLFILDNNFQNKALTWPKRFQKKGAFRLCDYKDVNNLLSK